MTIRPASSPTLTQCWFTRAHSPARRSRTRDDEYFVGTCRYCHRPIHSRSGNHWTLADGFDLDALAEQATHPFICVSDPADGLVIARIAIDTPESDDAAEEQLALVKERYASMMPDRTLDVRVLGRARSKTRT